MHILADFCNLFANQCHNRLVLCACVNALRTYLQYAKSIFYFLCTYGVGTRFSILPYLQCTVLIFPGYRILSGYGVQIILYPGNIKNPDTLQALRIAHITGP